MIFMTLTTSFIFFSAWALGAFANGIAGLGCAMIALPIVSSFMPPQLLVPISAVLVTFVCSFIMWQYKNFISYKAIIPMVVASIPGSFLGVAILLEIPGKTVQLIAGILIIFFVVWQILPKKERAPTQNIFYALLAGFTSGILNASISFGGPPVAIYALLAGWEKEEAFANINSLVVLSNIATMLTHAGAGLYTTEMLSYLAIGFVAAFIGVFLARPLSKRIDKKTFVRILLLLLAVAGSICIWRGIS